MKAKDSPLKQMYTAQANDQYIDWQAAIALVVSVGGVFIAVAVMFWVTVRVLW